MKRLVIALLAAAPLAGCAGYYGAGVGGGYYGPPAGYYDGFYDDAYGPIYDGYWGADNVFFYRSHAGDHFHADHHGHFRHDMNGGPGGGGHFHPMHGEFHGGGDHGGHGGGGHHGH